MGNILAEKSDLVNFDRSTLYMQQTCDNLNVNGRAKMASKSEAEKALDKAQAVIDLVSQGKDPVRIVVDDLGHGNFSISILEGRDDLLVVKTSPQQWPTEAERISQGMDPYRGSMQPVVNNQQEKMTMASKPPIEFTPFHVSVRDRLANAWGTTKRYVGTAATVGLVLPWLIPGPHTIVMGLGVAAGVGIAAVTGKKKNKVKVKK